MKRSNKMGRIVNLKVNCINYKQETGGWGAHKRQANQKLAIEPQTNNWGHNRPLFIKIVKVRSPHQIPLPFLILGQFCG